MDPLANCPGIYRPAEKTTWYYPSNSSPKEKTFCQFCVNRGCVQKEELDSFESNTCSCDCPCRDEHETFEVTPFICNKCQRPIDVSDPESKPCTTCQRKVEKGFSCCYYCSSVEKKCLICSDNITKDHGFEDFKLLRTLVQLGATWQSEDKEKGLTYWMVETTEGKKRVIHMAETFRVVHDGKKEEKKGFLTHVREMLFPE